MTKCPRISLKTILMLAALLSSGATLALAALPAPQMMAGFPMLAGPNVMVMWMPVPGAIKYNVYMDGQKIAETPAVNHMQPAPQAAGEYKFEVEAVDANGQAGPRAVGTVRIIRLEPPRNLAARDVGDRISLRWDSAPGAIIYNIFRSDTQGSQGALLNSVQAPKFDDTTAERGKTYYYQVTARDMSGAESKPSEALTFQFESADKAATKAHAKVNEVLIQVEGYKCVNRAGLNQFGFMGALAWDPAGEVLYAADESSRKIYVLNRDLGKVDVWPPEGANWEFKFKPLGIAIANGGEPIYVVDSAATIWVLSRLGAVIDQFDVRELSKGLTPPLSPVTGVESLALAPDGTLYATDSGGKQLVHVDDRGQLIGVYSVADFASTFGSVTVSKDGTLLAADPLAAKVFQIDGEGKKLAEIGEYGVIPGSFGRTNGLVAYADGKMIVVDALQTRLHVYDTAGKYLGDLGPPKGTEYKYTPAKSAYAVDFDPKTSTVFWPSKLDHEVCKVRVPGLP